MHGLPRDRAAHASLATEPHRAARAASSVQRTMPGSDRRGLALATIGSSVDVIPGIGADALNLVAADRVLAEVAVLVAAGMALL